MKGLTRLLAACAIVLLTVGGSARSAERIAAIVNKEVILASDVDEQTREAAVRMRVDPGDSVQMGRLRKEVLNQLVEKQVLLAEAQKQNITISNKEVDDEINRLARKFNLPPDQWLKMLKQERGISATQYAQDIVWPTLALRKLAASKLTVSPEEMNEAYEAEFGSAVQARMIVCEDPNIAKQVLAKAKANPDDFGNLAKEYSVDVNTASTKGMIPPIRRHVGDKTVEDVAFGLREGEVSPIIAVGNQHIILRCETIIPARHINPEDVRERLEDGIRERKLRAAAAEVFQSLQKQAHVENVYNDPAKSKQMPGVAAIINERKITVRDLAEECIERHGTEVLDAFIHRRILEQALAKRKLAVTDEDIEAEIGRAAVAAGKVTKSGQPDVQAWLQIVTQNQEVTVDAYIRDAVWPSVALKHLSGENVQVTDEDLHKGYEANYGPRVRCLAIVLPNQRKAQEVWELAREKPTPEYFGELAEEYSIEPASRALRGRVPPIQKWGGQPIIEKEAFALKPGELSSIIQTGDKYVVLLCEGRTDPTKVKFDEVRETIYEDLHEKKLRMAMAEEFDRLNDSAQIDNYLAGTMQSPKKNAAAAQPSGAVQPVSGTSPPGRQPGAVRTIPDTVPPGTPTGAAKPATQAVRPANVPSR
jgi:parvulin-like peptidyl-prolyl isomerase